MSSDDKEITSSQSLDESSSGLWWVDEGDGDPARVPRPRLRLLYHVDPSRIGATVFVPPEGLTLGRSEPIFRQWSADGDVERALDDRAISRQQLRIRWREEEGCFEVEPTKEARRTLRVVRLDTLPSEPPPAITEPTLLEPGVCLAIGDRAVLGLETTTFAASRGLGRLGMIGESDAMWRLREKIRDAADFGRPVLVLGETGTGKELVSRALHEASERSIAPRITANCATFPVDLAESILFGHRKGAFTGATANALGLFRAAEGGTLFLDEIGELSMTLQPKILRVLQDGLVTAVGDQSSVEVDVRVVAATHRDPTIEMAEGRLRPDLYHRLSTHLIGVPPLRARPFDIPELFIHLLAKHRETTPEIAWIWDQAQDGKRTLPLGFVVDLMRAPWPGNVRELQNIAERTAREHRRRRTFVAPELGTTGSADALANHAATASQPQPRRRPAELPERQPRNELIAWASTLLVLAPKTLSRLLEPSRLVSIRADDKEESDARAALAAEARRVLVTLFLNHNHKQVRVAETLGMSPTTLTKLMKRFDIRRPSDLSLQMIEETMVRTSGDLEAAARLLDVSSQGLRKRLTLLRLKD